jgi:hypothetical protein
MSLRAAYLQLVKEVPQPLQHRIQQLLQDVVFKDELQRPDMDQATYTTLGTIVARVPEYTKDGRLVGYTPVYGTIS